VALESEYQLFESVARKHFGLRSHRDSVSTPLRGTLRQLWKNCHVCLYIIKAIDGMKSNLENHLAGVENASCHSLPTCGSAIFSRRTTR
jgi:hypothetical protein